MNYGYFDDEKREYVITRPDTPRPWSNYLGTTEYGAVITNNAGGYSFYHSAAQGRFLRLRFNAIPLDQPGRYIYLRDNADGDYWSTSWQPVGKPMDEYQTKCRHGTAYTTITSAYKGIKSETTYFVPIGQKFEYWRARITNESDKPRDLSLFTYCEYATNWNTTQDLVNLQYSQYCGYVSWQDNMVRAASVNYLPEKDDFADGDQGRWSFLTFAGCEATGYELDRETFIGPYRTYANPLAVESGQMANGIADGDNGCGGMKTDLTLQPGETREILVILGVGKAETAGVKIRDTFGNSETCEAELQKLKEHWHGQLGTLQAQTPDSEFDHMVNVWNAYNALITFNWSRAASLVYNGERDGLGFRDSVQDVVATASLIPDQARERLLLLLSGQDHLGGALEVVKPFDHKPGQMTKQPDDAYRADDCLWFFNAVPVYVAETGDKDFYNTVVPYCDKGEDTVFGHLRKALEFNWERRGAHGLPCGLAADWNDCLRLGYKGESLFLTFQLRYSLNEYIRIAADLGKPEEADWAREKLAELDKNIQESAWNGDWFVRAFRDDGQVLGSKEDEDGECRIFLNAQSWAVLSGCAQGEQALKAMDEVNEKLATSYGIMICTPPYKNVPVDVIRAIVINPGHKENGGIFSHPQGWAVMAECMLGRGDRAYEYYRAYMPSAYNDRAEEREIEPYVHCQSTRSKFSDRFGTSRIPWLSGTATWSYFSATQHILGIRPEDDGLRIDPCIPADWEGFTAKRKFRGQWINITVKNPGKKNKGVTSLKVNGEPIEGNLLPAGKIAADCQVEAVIG